ncbi:GNAT family N-acetyltransferase [Nocardioides sp.]|uniref:GNAT family N-acetyltransferase n=1 Tax=Nocardioides sp. TaxID=35761 RepID=UPI003569B22F
MIYGKQVRLRPIEVEDLEDINAINDDPVVRSQVVGWAWPNSMADQRAWFSTVRSDSTQRWVILDDEDRIIGLTGLWDVDLRNRNALSAIKLGGRHEMRGRGLAVDIMMTVQAFAYYDLGIQRIYGSILEGNDASIKAFRDKCGFIVEGVSRKHVFRHGEFVDLIQLGGIKDEWDKMPDAQDYIDLIKRGR